MGGVFLVSQYQMKYEMGIIGKDTCIPLSRIQSENTRFWIKKPLANRISIKVNFNDALEN